MLYATRNFLGGSEKEGEAAGRAESHQPELLVVHPRKSPYLREIATHEREMVSFIDTPDFADSTRGIRVAYSTTERVARVGWIGDYAAAIEQVRRDAQQPRLWMRRVNL
jgi:hypothetical protein